MPHGLRPLWSSATGDSRTKGSPGESACGWRGSLGGSTLDTCGHQGRVGVELGTAVSVGRGLEGTRGLCLLWCNKVRKMVSEEFEAAVSSQGAVGYPDLRGAGTDFAGVG